MPHRTLRVLTLLVATAGACLSGSGALAQTAPSSGRYLTWANRPADTTPADVVAAQTRARNDMIPRRVAPSQAAHRPMMHPTAAPVPASRGLTPASAWLGPRVAPSFAPGSPDPIAYATTDLGASPPREPTAPQPRPVEPRPVASPATDPMAPAPHPHGNRLSAAPGPAPRSSTEQPAMTEADDPMAPRRDAPIFQMQQGQEQASVAAQDPAASSAQASSQAGPSGARYYSVHRDAGRRPDPTALPEPVYFDSVTMDLAEPPATEVPVRDAQGRRRVVANQDPSLP